jgi:hypothetical protein
MRLRSLKQRVTLIRAFCARGHDFACRCHERIILSLRQGQLSSMSNIETVTGGLEATIHVGYLSSRIAKVPASTGIQTHPLRAGSNVTSSSS